MERFVGFVVGGGVLLVAGLWGAEFSAAWTGGWLAGVVLAAAGAVALGAGIATGLSV